MTENYHQPRSDDVVLGGQNSQPLNAVVLGGMKGVKQRLANGNVKQKTLALEEALKYGQEGLELLMRSLKDEEWQVRHTSYALLQENVDPELKQALQKHNPYLQPIYFQTLIGRSEDVSSLAFSPDGSTLASGSYANTIKLWDMSSGRLKSTLTGHSDSVYCIAFSPDGSTLASGGRDHTIKLWDMGSGRLKSTLTGHSSSVNSIAFSPDGSTLASGSWDNTIKLWDMGSGRLKSTLTGHSWVYSIAFSPNGSTLASGSNDQTIKLWDMGSGELKSTLTGHSRGVNSIAFSPDGNTLASGSDDQTIKLWDMGSGGLKSTLTEHSDSVGSIAFSPDGTTLASRSSDKTIKLWDMDSGGLKSTLTGHSWINSIAFSPDGSILASRSSDEPIKLWELGNLNPSKLDLVKFFHCYIALKEVLNSGQVGLDQVIQALKGELWEVHEAAYSLLLASEEPRVKEALQEYNKCELHSAVRVDYARLRYLLAAQRWTEAEEETKDIMLKIPCQKKDVDVNRILDPLTQFDILTNIEDRDFTIRNELKCSILNQDLKTIYALWREYSNLYSDSFSQQKLGLNFWMTVKTKLEEIFARQEKIISDYKSRIASLNYANAMENRD